MINQIRTTRIVKTKKKVVSNVNNERRIGRIVRNQRNTIRIVSIKEKDKHDFEQS